ncbi:dynamin family protein [Microbispora sp. H10836]|uniref:dynamin family protein n=1 Tax=Microbispora sp. H10836 TaxID=2729106 RepID=UPI001473FCEE|nr:dynamin family protein [Microbispora sp. H10836]
MEPDYWLQLHKDVVTRFSTVIELLEEATATALHWSPDEGDSEASLRHLRGQLKSVVDLELRMPIVAPMKAGKSTIINAIVGYDLLPARSEAMTTLPTRIELADDLSEPELNIPRKDALLFSSLIEDLADPVEKHFAALADKLSHLEELLEDLRARRLGPIEESYRGHTRVLKVLILLNDLVRLSGMLLPEADLIGQLSDAPTLRTPYWRRPELDMAQTTGRLSLVDTPGPDETGVAVRLTGAVRTQLENCHVVLILLDYTAMGREADEKIKNLTDPVVEQIGRGKLYAVVNKVDQRRPGDRDNEGVQRFVRIDLGLVEDSEDRRIFETKGRLGLVAAKTLAALDRKGEQLVIADDPAARQFIWEQYEDDEDRDDALRTWSHEQLRKRAARKWDESGVPQLLQHVISRLRAEAMPILIGSALNRLVALLKSLIEVAQLRMQGAAANSKRIQDELRALQKETKLLERLRSDMPKPKQLSHEIQGRLNVHIAELREAGDRVLSALDVGDTHSTPLDTGVFDRLGRRIQHARETVGNAITGKKHRSPGVLEFATREEADRHITLLTAALMEPLRSALEQGRDEIADAVSEIATKVVAAEDRKARPIIERASHRLSTAFEVTLTVPELDIAYQDLEVSVASPQERRHTVKKTRSVEKKVREWKYWLKVIPRKRIVSEDYDVEESVFLVSQKIVQQELSTSFSSQIDQIAQELGEYVVGELSAQLKTYYDGLDAFLARYYASLMQALEDIGKSGAQQQEMHARLTAIIAAAEEHLTAIASFQRQLKAGK